MIASHKAAAEPSRSSSAWRAKLAHIPNPKTALRSFATARGGRWTKRALAPFAAILLIGAASNDPADRLLNPKQEAHARTLFREIRCLVCQNQSIDESDADLAEDLRKIVRQQVATGRSDREIRRYLVDRYGEFVLERPAFSFSNAVLWCAPFTVVFVGGAVLIARRRRTLPLDEPLTPEEEAKLTEISST